MKTCFKCGQTKRLFEFYIHPRMADGRLNKCKACTKLDSFARYYTSRERVREYEAARFQTPERKAQRRRYQANRRRSFPEKERAYRKVRWAIKTGKLIRLPCVACGDPKSQAHHEDYFRPLDVQWLCFRCHRECGHGQTVA
jgi:hypothetical protein